MGSFSRKIKRNSPILDIYLSMKFQCPICGFTRLVPKSEFDKMTEKTFKNNKLFFCNNCNIHMTPVSIEADF